MAACEGGASSWDKTTGLGPAVRVFSANVDSSGANSASYEDRLGPAISPWADSVAVLNAPVKSGARLSAFNSSLLGPEVLVGSLAVYVDLTTKDTIAIDLATQQEKWRLTPAQGSFLSKFMLTDGNQLCGVGGAATSFSAPVQCVALATGAMVWSKTLPLWLNPAPNQGYGLPGQFAFHNGMLFVIGGGQLHALRLTDGTDAWTLAATTHHRSLVFVGDDLVVEGVTASCAAGNSCLRAVNPETGATVAEYAAESASFLWAQGTAGFFLTPNTGATRMAVKYDSVLNQFTEDATLAPTFTQQNLDGSLSLGGVSGVLPSGKVYLLAGSNVMCRYAVAARKMDWCQQLPFVPGQLRLHSNVIFAGGAYDSSLNIVPIEPGTSGSVSQPRFYFGKWAFNTGEVYGSR